jgi:D-serine deaminase-like pyridoxal phosphate-dependent protein
MLDLQQLNTGMIDPSRISQKVIATVISYYPERGQSGEDEAICDAGAIALSKDIGPIKGHGQVVGKPWFLKGISQEHGILAQNSVGAEKLKVGERIEIVGQHACLIAAAFPWYYVVDSSTVGGGRVCNDIWIPCKGW